MSAATRPIVSLLLAAVLAACGAPEAPPGDASGEPPGGPSGGPAGTPDSACASGGDRTAVIDWVPFVRVDGRTYLLVGMDREEAAVAAERVGERLGEVRCRIADVVTDPGYRTRDGDAAFLEPGTPLHRLEGFDPGFRLVARTQDGDHVYEADPDEALTSARELYGDIDGRVTRIMVLSEADGETVRGRIDDPGRVAGLVTTFLDAPLDPALRPSGEGERYFMEFALDGVPPVNLVLFADEAIVGRGVRVPERFVTAIRDAGP